MALGGRLPPSMSGGVNGAVPPTPRNSSDWQGLVGGTSGVSHLAEDVSLEAGDFHQPFVGRQKVEIVVEVVKEIYAKLDLLNETYGKTQAYIEWQASGFGSDDIRGVTIVTRDTSGAITNVAIYHRSRETALRFSSELARRLETHPTFAGTEKP